MKGLPQNVLSALETLESASSPAELGGAYQTVLDWRRTHLNFMPNREVIGLLGFSLIMMLATWFIERLQIQMTEFLRGVGFGFCLAVVLTWIGNVFSGRQLKEGPLTLQERIEAALNRWRHLTPLMRDIPK